MWERRPSGLMAPAPATLAGASWADLDEVVLTLELLGTPTAKADLPNPFTRAGFDAWIARLERAANRTIAAAERAAIRAGAALALKDWRAMTPAAITAAIAAMVERMFSVPAAKIAAGGRAFASATKQLITASKKGTAAREALTIATTFNAVDAEMLAFTRAATEHFVRDRYGTMMALHSQVARAHVADGIRQGFSSRVIGEGLEQRMTAMGLARSRSYWNTVSSVYAARARTWGQLRSYEQAGIQALRFVSVLDENTTDVCRFMHGEIVAVGPAIQRYRDSFDAEPEAVTWLQPFVRTGKDDQGEILYYKDREGNRQLVARIEDSARGKRDETGRYSNAMGSGGLMDAGINTPPLHPWCRSTTVAVLL